MAERRGLDAAWVEQQLAQARRIDSVQKLMMPAPAGTAKDWGAYHDRFVEPRRITAGAAFWQVNADALQRAEERYGVPPEIVVGIVGVETFYGRLTGGFRVLDALATLSFDFPAAAATAAPSSAASWRNSSCCASAKGWTRRCCAARSPARWACRSSCPAASTAMRIDFDGDGHIDLTGSSADAIGSIAHYLAAVRLAARPAGHTTP